MSNAFGSVRLLVADDFPEDRELITDLARTIGIETVWRRTGQSAHSRRSAMPRSTA